MSADLRQPRRGRARHTYFVGRRPYEAPEVYAVTDDDVRRLRPNRRGGPLALDWHAGDARAVELSHVLLTSVARHRPPRELEQRFAVDVLAALPDDGFVLESDAISRWMLQAAQPENFAPSERPRRLPVEWLCAIFRDRTNARVTDG
jgi:hypothetical protein